MKKSITIFIIAAFVLVLVLIWQFTSGLEWNIQEIFMLVGLLLVIAFAIFLGIGRLQSSRRKEAFDDELSKHIKQKASSVSYIISIYIWLILMFLSDNLKFETHTIIGLGIICMGVVFAISWFAIKFIGMRNE